MFRKFPENKSGFRSRDTSLLEMTRACATRYKLLHPHFKTGTKEEERDYRACISQSGANDVFKFEIRAFQAKLEHQIKPFRTPNVVFYLRAT